ncbi:MAG: DUF465 domain-containing protein [Alphaproteobacteria bacterium]|jgi:hypothetical protein
MGAHRLASLRHRHHQFDRQLTTELKGKTPDEDAMHFFKMQKLRIKDLIADIETRPASTAVETSVSDESNVEQFQASA